MSTTFMNRAHVRSLLNNANFVYHTRWDSTSAQFYQNRQLEIYASKPANRITLRQLAFFGRTIDEERLIKSANHIRTEVPVRIAHRIVDLQKLPYAVVTQEGVAKVYKLYQSAFEKFRRYPAINTIADNDAFCDFLRSLLQEHATVIPNLTLGLSLASPHLHPDELDSFMKRMLSSRISRRVLAEHHIALSDAFAGRGGESADGEPHIGIIYPGLNVKRSIHKCAKLLRQRPRSQEYGFGRGMEEVDWPEVVVEGHVDTKFAYIREHLEYVVFELLKNSMRATVLKHGGEPRLPPIRATISDGTDDISIRISDQGGGLLTPQIKTPSDLFSFSHIRNTMRLDGSRLRALRVVGASQAGVWATVGEQVQRWLSQDNRKKDSRVESHSAFGIGLPMSNIFATYFGGSLELVSLDGWGTDVYLRLPKLGTNLEGIEV